MERESDFGKGGGQGWLVGQLKGCTVEQVEIATLAVSASPRLNGEVEEHVRLLAKSEAILPPIVVHQSTMRVIDGIHRLRAAALRGQSVITALMYDGDDRDAFVLSVQANVTHGLPLSLSDRTHAASLIIDSHPDWADRMIASVTGLAPGTIRSIRQRTGAMTTTTVARIGKDGRIRPMDVSAGRRLAGELITTDPSAPLRQIAKTAGISLSTAHDVRKRVMSGLDPVLPRRSETVAGATKEEVPPATRRSVTSRPAGRLRTVPVADRSVVMSSLRRDPSLRFTEVGKTLLRLLEPDLTIAEQRERVVAAVPPYLIDTVSLLARTNSEAWAAIADLLEGQAMSEAAQGKMRRAR
ncbi:hypothetical protein GCM10011609_84750 [Lentzea pudingi]|uniref:ParB-like N-terminal domain-containing protein n=1 Tax=Lentzea pudingi TaxID=1789439 RepID=A0ABQ2IWE8_9PSEU|nr:ParB/RepB/Spo0J family partition protein [Lentzea pudingi]GGN28544.1 hypothetical protein GCM10011609_84750 [Lentzea pudingi]